MLSRTSTHPASNCTRDGDSYCQYTFNVSSIVCVEDYKITVSAIDQLGQGPSTAMTTIGMECVTLFM